MLRSWRLGKLFAIPIYVHWSFLVWLFVLLTPGSLLTRIFMLALLLSIFGCVLLHEMGHALMARYFGIGTTDITLYPIGGVARLNRMSENPREELAIAVAGPAVNVVIMALLTPLVVLAFLSGVVRDVTQPGTLSLLDLCVQFVGGLWFANGVLVLFNMLPAFPMDGGRVLRALLSMALGQLRATEIAVRVGLVMVVPLVIVAFWFGNYMLLFVAPLIAVLGQQELFMVRRRAQDGLPQTLYQPPLESFDNDPAASSGAFEPSYRPTQPGFTGYIWDQRYQVWVRWHNGQPVATYGGEAR